VFKTDIDVIGTVKTSLLEIPHQLETYLWSLGAFAALAMLCFFMQRGRRKASLRSALAYAFPRGLYGHRTSLIDIVSFVFNMILWGPLLALISAVIIGVNVQDLLTARLGVRQPALHNTWAVVPVQFAVIFLCSELAAYISHLCFHKVPWLWSFHRTHHSAEALTFFTGARAHPIELVVSGIFTTGFAGLLIGTFLYCLGTPSNPTTTAALATFYGVTSTLLNILHHSHVWLSFGKLNYVFQAPLMHQLHHSAELRHRDKNLGSFSMIFDWLFGTIYVPKTPETYRWGLNDEELAANNPHNRLRDFYFEPFHHSWAILKSAATRHVR
jgi:sterol desaturase/sphingolipid hydroxylase (fatty acid hydroxylase superfamily)